MLPRLLHIYGPISINSYGFMIALGLLLFTYLTYTKKCRKKIIDGDTYLNSLVLAIISAFIGGRVLFILTNLSEFLQNPIEMLYPWIGGFSLLGSIIAILITLPIYLRMHSVPILPYFDCIAPYAPLLQAISRIGCFLAGCCYGIPAEAHVLWSVTFTNPEGLGPLCTALHPAQLYSSLASLSIFGILLLMDRRKNWNPGTIIISYLILESIARFTTDFWRGDRDFLALGLSSSQLVAICLFAGAVITLLLISNQKPTRHSS